MHTYIHLSIYRYIYGGKNSILELHEILRVNTAAKGNLFRFDLMKNSVVLDSLPRFISTQILVDEPVLIYMFILN